MAEASLQHLQPSRRGRQLLSAGLSADAGSSLSPHPASAIPQQASAAPQQASAGVADAAEPAQRSCHDATHPSHKTSSNAAPSQHAEESTSSMVSATSDLPQASTCPVSDSTTRQYPLPPPRGAPPLHAPRAIPGAHSSSIPLGPIKQPLQGGPPRNPLLPQAPQAPPLQPQQLHPASQLSPSQQRFQQMLKAASAVGYCQGLRQAVGHGPATTPLTFTTHQSQNSSQQPAQPAQWATPQQQTSLGDGMSLPPASGHKRSKEAAGLAQPPSKRQCLVYIAEPKPNAPPPSQGLVRFKCSIADILDAHWPGAAAQAASRQHTVQLPAAACSFGVAPQMGIGRAELPSAGAVPSRAPPSCLGRGPSRRLLSVPLCDAPANLPTPPLPSLPAATADAASACTAAFESLSLRPEAPPRRAMPPPQQRVTVHSVQQQVAAAQAAGWASSSPFTDALQSSSIASSSSAPRPHGVQTSASLRQSPRGHPPAQPLDFPPSSFPQVVSQLLSEPNSMQAWVAAYQPPSATSSQPDGKAADQSSARPQKRPRQGADSQQALALATTPSDRSAAAPATASPVSMFDNQHSSRLSSIQLLHLRARQHMAHADASSAAFSPSTSTANKPPSLGGVPTQTPLQPGRVLQSQPECSGSHKLPQQSPRGLPCQPPGDPGPSQWGGLHSSCPVGSEPGASQHVYAPAGTRPQDAAMQALLARLTQERNASAVLPSLPLAADPHPTPAAVPANPDSAPAPPAAPPDPGLASLTLLDGVAKHTGVSSAFSQQQQPPDRVASAEGLGLLQARDSCKVTRPRDALSDCQLPLDSGTTASQPKSVPLMPAALSPPEPS